MPEAMSARTADEQGRRIRRVEGVGENPLLSVNNLSTQTKEDKTRKSSHRMKRRCLRMPDAKPRKTVGGKSTPQWMADYMQLYYEKTANLIACGEGQYRL